MMRVDASYWPPEVISLALMVLVLAGGRAHAQTQDSQRPGISPEQRATLVAECSKLDARLDSLRRRGSAAAGFAADAALYPKAAAWALRYQENLSSGDLATIRRALERGEERAAALEAGAPPWDRKRGRLVRGYVSDVDGSVQPYGLVVPSRYDPARPMRLDVVLHGSGRPEGIATLRFLMPFDEGDTGGKSPDNDYIELHPLGRVENCYRWAGETDVFEAIADVCRRYNIDRRRIVLRGMSMGASGTWHLGLKHPNFFVALGPYCGYVDTHRFSETPGMNFVKVGPLPDYQEKMLHMLDSVDYAANAGVVPEIAAIGDRDPFFQAHVIMGEAMRREGLEMVNLISPGTEHVQDPTTFAEQMRRIGAIADRGLDEGPRRIRFVTWTLKYARCHWIELLALKEHYRRAEIEATIAESGDVAVKEPANVTRFAIFSPMLQQPDSCLTVGGQSVPLPDGYSAARQIGSVESDRSDRLNPKRALPENSQTSPSRGVVVERRGGRWIFGGFTDVARLSGKRPGAQGPIDDAFTSRFLCVRGTGKPWNPNVQAWSGAQLRRFAYEWSRYFLGDLPIKDDTAVTAEDCHRCNLILFGDPGSNAWIRKALPSLPLRWTRDTVRIGAEAYRSAECAPACIGPSPFSGAGPGRYVVLNSGHTFHEVELARLNYLLFPRLADWAVFKVGAVQPSDPSAPLAEDLLASGFCDERWKIAPAPRPRRGRRGAETPLTKATVRSRG
jgi:pimeloyl-ACP methyl ester carboxylesterase